MKKSISVVTIVSLFSSILLPTVVMAEDSELKVSNGKESTIISEETKDVAGESSENNEKTELVDSVETDLSKSNQDNVAINSDQSIVENESVFKEEKETASASISLEEQGKENEKQSSNETEEKKQENIENSDGVVQEEENTGEIQEEQDVINNDLKNEDREDTKSMDNVETFNSNGTERADWNISSETATEIILEKYKGSSKEIVIPTELDGKQVVVQNWKILLPDDITSLTVKEVNNRKIKLYSNASNIFTFKTNLRTVDLHGLDVSSVTNMSSMFRRCRSLESVEGLRDWDVSSVTNMSDMFNNCTSLNNVEGLRDWDVSSVTGMNDMFNNCTSLNNVEVLKGWDVSSVTSMNDMFNSCTSLNNVEELRDWDVSSVTSMSRMFSDCRSLESVEELRDWDVSSVANMDNMFRYCSSLEVVDLSGWKTDSLQNISRMFSDSNNLKAVDLSGFTLDKINSPMSNIFYNTSLTDTPLLVIAKDGKLKNYNYESDKRIPTKNIFDANSGAFDNGDTEHSAKHVYVIEDTENATINELIENAKTSVGIPTKTGYTFGGWEENTVRTRINNLLEVYNKLTATYKAKWTANEYKIKFDANGGTGIMPDQAMKYDQAEKLTKNEYTKEGYTFKGWSITPDGNVVYSDEVEVKNLTNKANDSITLYAVWEINNYNVTFDSQGGSSVDGQNVEYNAVVEKPTDPTKEGYTFGGWYKEAECITAWNFDTDKMPAGNITLYAKWILNTSELNHVPKINATDKILTVGDPFNPLDGVTAHDKEDGDIELTEDNIIANNVDMSQAGTYSVTYKVTDSKGASSIKTITVVVNPKMEGLNHIPTINATDKILTVGDPFNPLDGVTAHDKEDGDIELTEANIIANNVDTSKIGRYSVTYKVTDSNGASTTKTIIVTVKEKITNSDNVNNQQNNVTITNSAQRNIKKQYENTGKKKMFPNTGEIMNNYGLLSGILLVLVSGLIVIKRKLKI